MTKRRRPGWQRSPSPSAQVAVGRRWQHVREQALRRDHNLCQVRGGPGCTVAADQVHHIVAVAVDPSLAFELANLTSVCSYCHNLLSSQEFARRRNRRRPPPTHPADLLRGRE
jgi:5-methylcytosine-specific restriction endonuclease McrA